MALPQKLSPLDTIITSIIQKWDPAIGSPNQYGMIRQWMPSNGIVTYSIPDSAPVALGEGETSWRPPTAADKAEARMALEGWDDVIALSLVETTSNAADITVGVYGYSGSSAPASTESFWRLPAVSFDANGYGTYRYYGARVGFNGDFNYDD